MQGSLHSIYIQKLPKPGLTVADELEWLQTQLEKRREAFLKNGMSDAAQIADSLSAEIDKVLENF